MLFVPPSPNFLFFSRFYRTAQWVVFFSCLPSLPALSFSWLAEASFSGSLTVPDPDRDLQLNTLVLSSQHTLHNSLFENKIMHHQQFPSRKSWFQLTGNSMSFVSDGSLLADEFSLSV